MDDTEKDLEEDEFGLPIDPKKIPVDDHDIDGDIDEEIDILDTLAVDPLLADDDRNPDVVSAEELADEEDEEDEPFDDKYEW